MASRVFIVDGKPDTLTKLERLLKENHLEGIAAANPEDACNHLEQKILALERFIDRLQTSESLVKSISNNLPDGMIYRVVIGNDGTRKFTYISDSVKRLHGISPEEALADATLIYSRVHEDDIESLMKAEIEALKKISTFQMDVRIKTPSGGIRWSSLTSTPRLMEDGSICWDGIELVITGRKEAEMALWESKEKYRLLAEQIPDVVFVMDLNMKTTYVSSSVQDVLGFRPEERMQQTIDQQVTPSSLPIVLETFEKELALEKQGRNDPQKKMTMEVEIYHQDGSTRWTETILSGLRNEKGELTAVHGVLRDITARKRAEENLRERYKELNCLYSIADLIGKTDVLEELLQKIANRIPSGFHYPEHACARITLNDREFKTDNFRETPWKLSTELILKGKPIGAMDVCYLDKMPDRDKGPFLNEEESLVHAIAEHLGRVIERKKIEQASARLILELQKAMSEIKTLGGLIPICASCKKIRDDKGYWNQLELYLSEHAGAEFSHGICPECSKKLYPNVKEEQRVGIKGKSVVLIVDDEADFRTIFIWQIKRIIKNHEFEFVEAGDGEEALKLLEKGLKPYIIFLDNAMPKVDGMELLKRMDSEYPDLYDVPRVMLSGYSQEKVISEAEKLRCAFFDKNMDQKTLYQQIGQHIATKLGVA